MQAFHRQRRHCAGASAAAAAGAKQWTGSKLAAAASWWHQLRQQNDVPIREVSNPTEFRTAIGFSLLYAVVLFFEAWLSDIAGSGGPLLAKRCALGMTLTAAGIGVALLLMKS